MNSKVAIIIPARLASTRLPNKPLLDINGKTMISRVYEKALQTGIENVFVACDSDEIAKEVESFSGRYVLTDSNLPSGTDRIYSATQKIGQEFDYIVNLQGDLPNVDPAIINEAVEILQNQDCDIATLASVIKDQEEVEDVNIVKIAIAFKESKIGRALYFSRSPIPYNRDKITQDIGQYYHHIGIYAYRRQALEKFVNLEPSNLEKLESLEQLRALESDMSIYVKITESNPLSVDTQSDLDVITNLILDEES